MTEPENHPTLVPTSSAALVLPIRVSLTEGEHDRLLSSWKFYSQDMILLGGEPLIEPASGQSSTGDEDGEATDEEEEPEGCSCGALGTVCSRQPDADGHRCECIDDYGQFFVQAPSSPSFKPRRVLALPHPSHLPLVECGPACACTSRPTSACQNRLTQSPPSPSSIVLRSAGPAGLGLFATGPLPAGSFICTYAGELISTQEARNRWAVQEKQGWSNYIFSLKSSGGRVNIDPRVIGGIGRFLNHSHAPNLIPHPIYRTPTHLTVPRIAFFASREISPGEALTWDYGDGAADSSATTVHAGPSSASPPGRRVPCACGAELCDGWMPFDPTL